MLLLPIVLTFFNISYVQKDDQQFINDIQDGISVLEKKSPQVHKDALRIWKNFKAGKSDPHMTYRYWGRDLILWLQDVKKYSFNSYEKIEKVFQTMSELNIISKDAAKVLSHTVFSLFSYLQGSVDPNEKIEEQRKIKEKEENLFKSI